LHIFRAAFTKLTFFAFATYFKHQAFWGFLMRCIATLVLAGTVIVSSSAFAGEGAFKPGLPAGVHQAQGSDNTALLAVGAMAAAASLALIISSTSGSAAPAAAAGGGGSTSTSTSTTS
jgi:hypothetical protein